MDWICCDKVLCILDVDDERVWIMEQGIFDSGRFTMYPGARKLDSGVSGVSRI